MINNDIVKISIVFNGLFDIEFNAAEIPCDRGKIYQEKNFEKNLCDLAHITLFNKEKRILLNQGIFFLDFQVIEGDTENFFGEYKLAFGNYQGMASVSKQ